MPPRRRERLKKLNKPSKEERAGRRSHVGFLLAAAVVLGGVAASIWRVCSAAQCAVGASWPRLTLRTLRRAPHACRGFVAAERKIKQRSQARRCSSSVHAGL
jgi:hypothetical protein